MLANVFSCAAIFSQVLAQVAGIADNHCYLGSAVKATLVQYTANTVYVDSDVLMNHETNMRHPWVLHLK